MSIGVHTDDADYVAAIAELPLSAHRSHSREGAIVVVSRGSHWADRARDALDAGARALVLRDLRGDPAEADGVLAVLPAGIPVMLDRPRMRADLVEDVHRSGTRAPALLQIECSATSADLASVARDAVGWARVLAGGPLEHRASRATPRGFSMLLDRRPDDGLDPLIPVSLLATRRPGSSPWIRVTAIGAERTEVTVDVARRSATVELTTGAGRAVHPTRWESGERVALRRAIEAVESGSTPPDLRELVLDTAVIALVEPWDASE